MSDTTLIVEYKINRDDDRFEGVTETEIGEVFYKIVMGEFATLIRLEDIRQINVGPTEFMD